jgi:hypothetical protein
VQASPALNPDGTPLLEPIVVITRDGRPALETMRYVIDAAERCLNEFDTLLA